MGCSLWPLLSEVAQSLLWRSLGIVETNCRAAWWSLLQSLEAVQSRRAAMLWLWKWLRAVQSRLPSQWLCWLPQAAFGAVKWNSLEIAQRCQEPQWAGSGWSQQPVRCFESVMCPAERWWWSELFEMVWMQCPAGRWWSELFEMEYRAAQ